MSPLRPSAVYLAWTQLQESCTGRHDLGNEAPLLLLPVSAEGTG